MEKWEKVRRRKMKNQWVLVELSSWHACSLVAIAPLLYTHVWLLTCFLTIPHHLVFYFTIYIHRRVAVYTIHNLYVCVYLVWIDFYTYIYIYTRSLYILYIYWRFFSIYYSPHYKTNHLRELLGIYMYIHMYTTNISPLSLNCSLIVRCNGFIYYILYIYTYTNTKISLALILNFPVLPVGISLSYAHHGYKRARLFVCEVRARDDPIDSADVGCHHNPSFNISARTSTQYRHTRQRINTVTHCSGGFLFFHSFYTLVLQTIHYFIVAILIDILSCFVITKTFETIKTVDFLFYFILLL